MKKSIISFVLLCSGNLCFGASDKLSYNDKIDRMLSGIDRIENMRPAERIETACVFLDSFPKNRCVEPCFRMECLVYSVSKSVKNFFDCEPEFSCLLNVLRCKFEDFIMESSSNLIDEYKQICKSATKIVLEDLKESEKSEEILNTLKKARHFYDLFAFSYNTSIYDRREIKNLYRIATGESFIIEDLKKFITVETLKKLEE